MNQYALLGITIFLLAAGQVVQKLAAEKVDIDRGNIRALQSLISTYQFWMAVSLMGAALAVWLLCLSLAAVGKTYPLLAASYVITAVASKLLLHEEISPTRWAGIVLVTSGAALMVGWG